MFYCDKSVYFILCFISLSAHKVKTDRKEKWNESSSKMMLFFETQGNPYKLLQWNANISSTVNGFFSPSIF